MTPFLQIHMKYYDWPQLFTTILLACQCLGLISTLYPSVLMKITKLELLTDITNEVWFFIGIYENRGLLLRTFFWLTDWSNLFRFVPCTLMEHPCRNNKLYNTILTTQYYYYAWKKLLFMKIAEQKPWTGYVYWHSLRSCPLPNIPLKKEKKIAKSQVN